MSLVVIAILLTAVVSLQYTLLGHRSGGGDTSPQLTNRSVEALQAHYQLFSTHTAYNAVRGSGIKQMPGCQARGIWGFLRHGTRYPKEKDIDRIKKLEKLRDKVLLNHSLMRGQLTRQSLDTLRSWRWLPTREDQLRITAAGYTELISLGRRLNEAFPHLLGKENLRNIKTKRTSSWRTVESGAALFSGMTGLPIALSQSTIDDRLLWNQDGCPFWKKLTDDDRLQAQSEKLRKSRQMSALTKSVSLRLGFDKDLGYDTIKIIYRACGFETSWYRNENSTWCSVFTKEELQLLEYERDLHLYWDSGYGNPYTARLGCELLQDMTQKLDKQEIQLNIAHETGIRYLLVALGIGKCPLHLTAADGALPGRAAGGCWSTSRHVPFAANIIAVLYGCETGDEERSLQIAVYLNERTVQLCEGKDLCPYQEFKARFANLTDPAFCNRSFCSAKYTSTALLNSIENTTAGT